MVLLYFWFHYANSRAYGYLDIIRHGSEEIVGGEITVGDLRANLAKYAASLNSGKRVTLGYHLEPEDQYNVVVELASGQIINSSFPYHNTMHIRTDLIRITKNGLDFSEGAQFKSRSELENFLERAKD